MAGIEVGMDVGVRGMGEWEQEWVGMSVRMWEWGNGGVGMGENASRNGWNCSGNRCRNGGNVLKRVTWEWVGI